MWGSVVMTVTGFAPWFVGVRAALGAKALEIETTAQQEARTVAYNTAAGEVLREAGRFLKQDPEELSCGVGRTRQR